MYGGYYYFFQSFDPSAHLRYDVATGDIVPVFVPVQRDPANYTRERFRAISPIGKTNKTISTYRYAPQPVDHVTNQWYAQKPARPQGGKATSRGYFTPEYAKVSMYPELADKHVIYWVP